MYTWILVPHDGSDFGDRALPLAVSLARRSKAMLELVHIHEPYIYASGAPAFDRRLDDELRAKMRHRLENTRERVAQYLGHEVLLARMEGPVARTLEKHVADSGADLVVMTTHGRGGMSRIWLGSVADHMTRHSPVPVLFVRPSTAAVTWREGTLPRRIVIPLDGSELAETILDHAVILATPGETELALIQVVVPLAAPSYPHTTSGFAFTEDDLARRQRTAETYLERLAVQLRAHGFATTVRITTHEQIARAILDYAMHADADLIALATHGRGAAARLAIGSVADKVLRAAITPLLMFRPAPEAIERFETATAHATPAQEHTRQAPTST